MSNTTKYIDITPDYRKIMNGMLNDARLKGSAKYLFDGMSYADKAAALREVQGFLAPLNVAAASMQTAEDVEKFQEVLGDLVTGIAAKAQEIENDLEEDKQ